MKRVIFTLVAAVIAFSIVYFDLFGPVDKLMEDILHHRPSGTDERIKIIKIDERSLSAIGDYEEWNRDIYARLIETLCVSDDIKPAVIGFDVIFSGDYETAADQAFVDACKKHGNVVCAFNYVFTKELVSDEYGNLSVDNLSVSEVVYPFPALYEVTRHGFANALMDNDDGLIRSSFMYYPPNPSPDQQREFSLNTEIYTAYCDAMGLTPSYPFDLKKSTFSFRYSGRAGDFENVSLSDVLSGEIPAEAFDDCIVLVGAYTAGMMDAYYVPVDRGQQMYGVEIHANVIQSLIEGKTLTIIPAWIDAAVTALLIGVLAFICYKTDVTRTAVIGAAFVAAKLVVGDLLFNIGINGTGFSGSVPGFPVSAIIVVGYLIAAHYYTANRTKRQIEHAFKKYVAPQVVNELAARGNFEIKLGGETREVAVLFVDIRGFTPLSESLEPEQVVEILNSYLKLTTSCIFRHGGMLDKFIGDATMAVFNAPFDSEDYVYKAVLAAWDIVQGGARIEKQFVERFGKHVGFGVGVNCGRAVVGNIGCDFRMDYTAIGDTVNTAARLEANAPRGEVYISGAVYEQVKDRVNVREVGEIPLKGKSVGVFVYSITEIPGYESEETVNFEI